MHRDYLLNFALCKCRISIETAVNVENGKLGVFIKNKNKNKPNCTKSPCENKSTQKQIVANQIEHPIKIN